jgi:hypothetical protein
VVGEKFVAHTVAVADLFEQVSVRFHIGARICEDQVVLSAEVPEEVFCYGFLVNADVHFFLSGGAGFVGARADVAAQLHPKFGAVVTVSTYEADGGTLPWAEELGRDGKIRQSS